MKLRIGNQTAFTAGSALEPFEFALEQGFKAFEFFPDRGPAGTAGWDERGMSLDEREYIRRAAEACGLALAVHAPLAFDPLKGPSDSRLESTVELARDIGAGLVNLHLDMSQGAEAFGRALLPALKATHKAGLNLALENTVWTGPGEVNTFFDWLCTHESPLAKHAGLCFDLGHANVCAATLNDYCEFLDQLSPGVRIIHLHLHENFGDRDAHLPLFTGPSRNNPAGILGLLQRLQDRCFDGCAILEQWPRPPGLLVEARDRLELLLNTLG